MFLDTEFLKRSTHHTHLYPLDSLSDDMVLSVSVLGTSLKQAVALTVQAYWRLHLLASRYQAMLAAGPGQLAAPWKLP